MELESTLSETTVDVRVEDGHIEVTLSNDKAVWGERLSQEDSRRVLELLSRSL